MSCPRKSIWISRSRVFSRAYRVLRRGLVTAHIKYPRLLCSLKCWHPCCCDVALVGLVGAPALCDCLSALL